VVPALPEKNVATKVVNMGADFVAQRCASLDVFVKRCAAHATLRSSPQLAAFLQATEAAWAAIAAAPLPRDSLTLAKQREGSAGTALLKEFGRAAGALLAGRPDAADAEGEALASYSRDLEAHLTECQQTLEKLISRQVKLAAALHDFGLAMAELGKSQEGDAAVNLAALAQCCAKLAKSGGAKAAAQRAAVDAPMVDLVRSLSGVHAALQARAGSFATVSSLSAEAEAKAQKIGRMRVAGGVEAMRLAGEEREQTALAKTLETAKAEHAELCSRLAAELERSDAERAQQLQTLVRALGSAQRELARDQAAAFAILNWRREEPAE